MKICPFCGTEASDTATTCDACGANQFETKCNNCGTIFDIGMYCPNSVSYTHLTLPTT